MIKRPSRYPTWRLRLPPACSAERTRGKHLAKRSLERHAATNHRLAERQERNVPNTDQRPISSLSEHPRADLNDLWLVISLQPRRQTPQCSKVASTSDVKDSDGFTQATAKRSSPHVPWEVRFFRPQPESPQTKVIGAASRRRQPPRRRRNPLRRNTAASKVQFHWDAKVRATIKPAAGSEFLPVGLEKLRRQSPSPES